MTQDGATVAARRAGAAFTVTLNRPRRHNCLDLALVEALRGALAQGAQSDAAAIILRGAGPSFSSGGDIKAFLAHGADLNALRGYAHRLVGALHGLLRDMLASPLPIIARVQGLATGGALGLVLAADLAAMAEDAFLQPYYGAMGFAPDGGWTALLPERVGPSRAARVQFLNQRLPAAAARDLGIVDAVAPEAGLDEVVAGWLDAIARQDRASLAATKRLVWDHARLDAIARRLDAERQAFIELIARPEAQRRMADFMACGKARS
ncbi:MAG: enoyl-CoA hydratase/isomerase family protein [Pseudomonadota bacterium]